MRVALIPLNPTVADLDANATAIASRARAAADQGAGLIVLPELALTGYPPRDLLLREDFLRASERALERVARELPDVPTLVGAPALDGDAVRNSLFLLARGRLEHRYDKRLLPGYSVFDEPRYFEPGETSPIIEVAGRRVGLTICEDLWKAADVPGARRYHRQPDPLDALAGADLDLLVNVSASPFVLGKDARQRRILESAARRVGAPVLGVNQLGANDELIFDGAAHVALPPGAHGPEARCLNAPRFEDRTHLIDVGAAHHPGFAGEGEDEHEEAALFSALTLGIRDYARKTGFSAAALGLSGGIDSALVAALAAAALGASNVHALAMPSRYSSAGSVSDAREQARRLGLRLHEVPIRELHDAAERTLGPLFAAAGASSAPGIAEENVQSRLRGALVMALANKLHLLPLATGNKSEMAVGYATLYGDMNGGLAPIADLSKTRVYALSRWINARHADAGFSEPPIPDAVLSKAPSAELRPDQKDEDTLPPYDVLDAILDALVDERAPVAEAARRAGAPLEVAERVAGLLARAEYKRRQMPPGLKVTREAFGIGRRLPIAKAWEATPAGDRAGGRPGP